MTFVLTPLSHYNSITEPRAQFLLSLLEDLFIEFLSHFIISIIDVYKDTVTCDELIFPSAITRILHHFSIPIPDSPLHTIMGLINVVFVRQSEAQLRPKWPRTKTTDPPTLTIPSTFAPSSMSGVTLEAVMAQLHCMDCLDTFTTELYQVNTHVGCIAQRQAHLGGFITSPSPFLEASEDKDAVDGDDDDEDKDASSSSDKEMATAQ